MVEHQLVPIKIYPLCHGFSFYPSLSFLFFLNPLVSYMRKSRKKVLIEGCAFSLLRHKKLLVNLFTPAVITVLPHMRILAHTHMGCPICVYSYGTPIRIWDNILSHISINILFGCFISLQAFGYWCMLYQITVL